ncbi:DNA glycosylase AlkZ-like family protein [Flavobacterium sp. HSC-61S13]|uniref:DNA glycosylase AlkZ-like family protein n=1 Tax=Flavobacterium sp. HSC-61S13 TaxID=2910963 RepID=UPI00209E297E|nr:crosslink repair DNA glycosylase YcaQ family protein [Flavobacterium sp. HSC-61S13]MCP1996210.1 uncharacterized protein YcaQ [Flavobacterium sp. HSC-61S13]
MTDLVITKEEAKKYVLYKHGLFGDYQYQGKQGILDFIAQSGCIQFDPVDVVGRNADLTLQSRIENYDKNDLYELLYQDRLLVDGHDKMMSIYNISDWHHLQAIRSGYLNREDVRFKELSSLAEEALNYMETQPFVSSIEIESDEHILWGYGSAKKSRAVLDLLFYQGKIVVHHKERSRRFYAPRSRFLEPDQQVFDSDDQQMDWHVLRRIAAVGLLWNQNSDAFLGIANFNAKSRIASFKRLLDSDRIQKVKIDGIHKDFYIKTEDITALYKAKNIVDSGRLEFIAPLDPLLWDRKFIAALFDFDYKWEIYTPKEKRTYGHYVLPVIFGSEFIGRIEFEKQAGNLAIKQFWKQEQGVVPADTLINSVYRFAKFNDLAYP